ncbi:hypothetical protein [Rhodocyclus purpureus]|uniref:hypothetical protein n=1 Tax=Rhodocyclus purpureus TaxID=1067 RepID=UPI0019146801|nr:hypothetical protein [Rhodocyclus purpureus]MBK5914031.1 hypothetical protein [Rhodocyclus purpureus]
MPTRTLPRLLVSLFLGGSFALANAGEAAAPPPAAAKPAATPIYGSQLMTAQERSEYRSRMRSAKSAEEREKVRLEHHEAMKARAAERGVTLPDAPPPQGMGQGKGPGGGMGPGRGMGMGPGMGAGGTGSAP